MIGFGIVTLVTTVLALVMLPLTIGGAREKQRKASHT